MGMRPGRKLDMVKRSLSILWARLPSIGAYLIVLGFIGIPAAAQEQASIMGRTDGGTYYLAAGSPYDRTVVRVRSPHEPGTIIIDTERRFLYLLQPNGTAIRYGVGVGRPGFEWAGIHRITSKAEWPDWHPPAEMRRRQPYLPVMMPGGPNNPLGARALYLGSTLYRIHGTSEPHTIGRAVSSGCIRMRNEDVEDLYSRVDIGTKVVVF